jgi:hypothetical protein
MTKAEEIALVKAVIAAPIGYDLDLFGGMLVIRSAGGPMSDEETIEVEWEVMEGTKPNKGTASFASTELEQAAIFFVEKRRELRIGLDFEQIDALKSLKRESPR